MPCLGSLLAEAAGRRKEVGVGVGVASSVLSAAAP